MSVSAQVVDGVLQQKVNSTDSDKKTSKATNSSTLDKDAFLQLLVAQMKYQDPLEPTSNTEYISQYATFSELEQMQNMSSTMELSRAASLVGQTVVVETTDDNGNTTSDMGVVDYISYENSKALVWVNGNSYPLDGVVEVADAEYIEAYSMALTLVNAIRKLPPVANLSISEREAVESIQKTYESMNEYQQSFVAEDVKKQIEDYVAKMEEVIKLDELNKKQDTGDAGKTDGADGGDDAGKTE
ncbi:MAG: flagellar hook capping protein [Lachnospiraceae bacterium]|nr:flagellar hook capping protein [Lachnospiraceae bacterium]